MRSSGTRNHSAIFWYLQNAPLEHLTKPWVTKINNLDLLFNSYTLINLNSTHQYNNKTYQTSKRP
jgi:hypothetical protein